jgi:hypothetical protein
MTNEPRLRLETRLDGTADLYAELEDGTSHLLVPGMTPEQVREFRQIGMPNRIPNPATDN